MSIHQNEMRRCLPNPCLKCSAGVGQSCVKYDGQPALFPHTIRVQLLDALDGRYYVPERALQRFRAAGLLDDPCPPSDTGGTETGGAP
jgi:hypothetical protein